MDQLEMLLKEIRLLCAAVVVAMAAATAGVAWAQTPATGAQPESTAAGQPAPSAGGSQALSLGGGGGQEYVIGPEDVVDVNVVGQPDHTRARVYTDGSIQVALIGRVNASGRTPKQLGADIAAALKAGGYYADPVVSVEVVGYSSRYVTVLGSVAQPGLVPINRTYRLSELLARVGGVREGAADYLIVRPESGPEKRYIVDKLAAGDASQDPQVHAGDKIFIPPAEMFYITGQVKSPGTYPIKTDMTIAQAIARGGGLTDSGSDKKVGVTRAGKKVKMAPTEKVQPGDILDIGERLF
ncbi:MAG: SLBB domain-containing protein [Phenylobacterium sp.]